MSAADISEENIVWSGQDFKLSEFVDVYHPPQIVKVEEGYLDEEEDRSLSSSQVLTLHMVKEIATVNAFVNQGHKVISLPVNSSACVEIITKPSYYESVEELARDLPPFVASMEVHPWLRVDVNDILEVKSVSKSLRTSHLICKNLASGGNIELPLNYTARFKSLGQCPVINPTMADITKHCKLPVVVRYVDDTLKVIQEGFNADYPVGIDKLGQLTLKSVSVNKVVVTTPWGYDRMIPLPLHLQVRVVAAVGALQNDRNYSRLCAIAHSNTNADDLDIKFIKEGGYKVLLEEKQSSNENNNDDENEYFDVGPPVPSRNYKPDKRRETRSESHSPSEGMTTTRFSRSQSDSMAFGDVEDAEGDILDPEDVFGDNFETKEHSIKTKLKSVKKAFKGIKEVTKHDFKVFKKALSPKLEREKRIDGVTPDLSHASHAASTHTLPKCKNKDLAYGEVPSLPPYIQADRVNKGFASLSMKKSSSFQCKIRNPHDIRTWTIEEVAECLRYCRLDDYVDVFKQEMIDGGLLADLDEDSLKSLGLTNKLHILKLMKIINEGWLPKQ